MNAQWKEIPQIRCMLPADLDGVVAVEHEEPGWMRYPVMGLMDRSALS